MRSPSWSTPVISPAPSANAPSCVTSKPPRTQHRPPPGSDCYAYRTAHLAGCPNAEITRKILADCLASLGIDVPIIDRVGRYPSPTVLVDGVDVMRLEAKAPTGDACRLDLPTPQHILDALRPCTAAANSTDSQRSN